MLKGNCRLGHLLMIALIGLALFGCDKKEKELAPGGEAKGAAGYEVLLPAGDVPEGWKQSGETMVFVGEKLYDSINGAADRFFQYAFREEVEARYTFTEPDKSMGIQVYDMGTPENAFGIFSGHDSVMSDHANIGLAAMISEMNLDFCQGKYFVRLLATGFEEREAGKPLRAFAETMAGNIEPAGAIPKLIESLPEGYAKGSLFYFHTMQSLNERRYMAEENALQLSEKTNAVLASYTVEDKGDYKLEKDIVYLVEYPDQKSADAAKLSYVDFLDRQVKASREEGKPANEKLQLITVTEPTWISQLYKGEGEERVLIWNMRAVGKYIFGVWEITDAEKAKALATTLLKNLHR